MKIENEQLIKILSYNLDKYDDNNFTTEELNSIENIRFDKKLINGKDTHLSIEAITLFKNLKSITLAYYDITDKDIELLNNSQLINISFMSCDLSNIDLKFNRTLNQLFFYDSKLPLNLPQVTDLHIMNCDVYFETIDFKSLEMFKAETSTIYNVKDLVEYSQIKYIIFTNTDLVLPDGTQTDDIKVGDNCSYTHQVIDTNYVDNMR